MSATDSTGDLPGSQKHDEFFSAHSGAALAGVTPHTVRRLIAPDALVWGHQGKHYPLYRRETLEGWAAGRKARGGAE